MVTEKIFKIMVISFLFAVPVATKDIPPIIKDPIVHDDQNGYELVIEGNASYGSSAAIGKACIVGKRKQLKRISPGDIVITPSIDSNWYAELNLAAAIIVEKGDETSHAIALGKKLGIPVIVGASGATKKIVDGQTIMCDPITRNIYHIAYPSSPEAHFDTLVISQKNHDYQVLHDKLINTGRSGQSQSSLHVSDYVITDQDQKSSSSNIVEPKNDKSFKIKNLFHSQFAKFKDWVFTTKKELILGRHSPRWVLKSLGGCDDFAVDCIPLSYVLFDGDDIVQVLKSLESDDNLEYIGSILEECKQKPGDVNWAGRVAHKKNAATVPIPKNINREKLIKDPKAYIAVQDSIDAWERKIRIAAGLFARFCVQKKLIPK